MVYYKNGILAILHLVLANYIITFSKSPFVLLYSFTFVIYIYIVQKLPRLLRHSNFILSSKAENITKMLTGIQISFQHA